MANKGKVFLAGVFGALAGAIGGLLLAPQSGKATRDDILKLTGSIKKQIQVGAKESEAKVREVFGNANKAATDKYKKVRTAVVDKVAEVKSAGKEIDKEKYSLIVDDVVETFKDDFVTTKNGMVKMASLLKKDWEKVKKALV